jgi:hypothetical protein
MTPMRYIIGVEKKAYRLQSPSQILLGDGQPSGRHPLWKCFWMADPVGRIYDGFFEEITVWVAPARLSGPDGLAHPLL